MSAAPPAQAMQQLDGSAGMHSVTCLFLWPAAAKRFDLDGIPALVVEVEVVEVEVVEQLRMIAALPVHANPQLTGTAGMHTFVCLFL